MRHLDGYHKLIRYGVVIHGMTDGYSRVVSDALIFFRAGSDAAAYQITALKAHNNNRATTVLKLFKESVEKGGTPSRVRGDRGGENIKVAVWMIIHHGSHRGSFLWGK